MTKQQRKKLEELSLKAFGNKNYYRRVEKHGLKYKDPTSGKVAILRLTDEGLVNYLEKTIKVRDDFNKAVDVLSKEDSTDVRTEGN